MMLTNNSWHQLIQYICDNEYVRKVGLAKSTGNIFKVGSKCTINTVTHLSPEQAKLLHQTLAVNSEAAVLWILAMEEVE